MSNKASVYYRIQELKPNLILVRWFVTPSAGSPVVRQWLKDLLAYLNDATESVYFISDLRVASITDVYAIREAVNALKVHPNYGGGTAFSQKTSSTLYANLFARLSRREKPTAESLEASLLILEELHPGITHNVDWQAALQDND